MEKLKYPENVDYVMNKYGPFLEKAFIGQRGLADKRKGSYNKEDLNVRENFVNKMEEEARRLGLNQLFTRIIAQNYLTKSMCFGNEIERTLSKFKRDIGIGMFCFDALSLKDEIYRKNYKKYIIENLKREIGDEKRRKLRKEEFIDYIVNNDATGSYEEEIEYENRLIQLGETEISADQEVIEDVIDLIIDGSIPIKIEELEKSLEEMQEGEGKLTEKVESSMEAKMVKELESIYSMEEAQLALRNIEKRKLNIYASRNKDRNKKRSLVDSRIFAPQYDIYLELQDTIARIINEQRSVKTGNLHVNMQQISHVIDIYAKFLLEDDSYFIKRLLEDEQNTRNILESFIDDEPNRKKNEFYDLLRFISNYSKGEYEDIRAYVLNSLNETRNSEWEQVKAICKGKNFQESIQSFKNIIGDENRYKSKYKRMKRYLDIYLTYGRAKNMPEFLRKEITDNMAIAYEFAIRFLSTKSPEQLLDIVKGFEEYEKSFENTTRKSGGIEI